MLNPLVLSRRVALILGSASALALTCSVAAAAQPVSPSQRASIEAQYKREVARCNSGATSEGQATCLKEAGAARQQALQGGLDNQAGVGQNYRQNALDRCKLLPASQQGDCMGLMQDPSQTEGSVSGGGVLREREYVVPVQPNPSYMPPPPAPIQQ